jgi:SAM-dependent methyltransferase
VTVFVAHSNGSAEFRACLFCSANERYELLAVEIRDRYWERLPDMDVLELDPKSPLMPLLSRARSCTRTFHEEGCSVKQRDGAIWEDITDLTFQNGSLDLLISSDVLEHVPRLEKALSETARVLRPNGAHLFTVPPRLATRKRAEIVNGELLHIEPPDFHLDPLSPEGILAFWDIGPDLASVFPTKGLDVKIVHGPAGESGRVVWLAVKSPEVIS